VRALIDWASSEQGIQRFIASISPENEPSLALARRLGFKHIGRHWDEEDGEELEFELRISDGA
jgi:ribosomal-protein-alanine N-acetyltransferase